MATILIVDDHAPSRQFLTTLLQYKGHRLLEACDGSQALDQAEAAHPDLVITDILMPNMDGYELVRRLRQLSPEYRTKAIFYSAAYLEQEARALANACGVSQVLRKPADPEEILRIVEKTLANGEAIQSVTVEKGPDAQADKVVKILSEKLYRKITEVEELNAQLEQRVAERTKELEKANRELLQLISERERSEKNLRLAEEHFRLLVDGVRDYAIFTLDAAGRVASWNKGAERIKGYEAGEVLGKHASIFYPEADVAAGKVQMELEIAARDGECIDEGLRVRKDGELFFARVVVTALKDDHGVLRGFSKLTRDITAQKRAEEELKRSNSELQQFAYVASHDLQEPLRMVANYTQLLGQRYRGKLDSDADEFIDFAVDGAQRMNKLIEDLLEFSRVGTRGKEFRICDTEAIIQNALKNLSVAIEEGAAEIKIGVLPSIKCDASQMEKVFQNLIGNAIKYRSRGIPCVIEISASRGKGEWVFCIKDNGIGIEPQHFARIFQIFQRLHTRDEYPGTGIGLTICKRIVERHGGRIWLDSRLGAGTMFFFTVPLSPAEVQQGTSYASVDKAAELAAS